MIDGENKRRDEDWRGVKMFVIMGWGSEIGEGCRWDFSREKECFKPKIHLYHSYREIIEFAHP